MYVHIFVYMYVCISIAIQFEYWKCRFYNITHIDLIAG